MMQWLLVIATLLQIAAMVYGLALVFRPRGATGAWLFLLGAMSSMLAWRIAVTTGWQPRPMFNVVIAIWGSTCMLVAMMLFAAEIARRERAEAERDHLLESERAARTDAERAGRAKDEFLATLSHELRTPLTAILGWCSILRQDGKDDRDLPKAIGTIERNARLQVRLVDELLDATRIQAGTLHLDTQPLHLDGPVKAALEAVKPAADAKAVTVEFHGEQPSPVVNADAGRIQQIVSNILVNAVKFTPAGGRIDVTVSARGDRALLTVADTGEGIPPDFIPHLFTRFRQAETGDARRHGGLGLGLSIAQSLARLHDGTIRGESDGPGKGATFTLTLPRADAPARQPAHVAPPPADPSEPLHGLRILVVDDEQDVRGVVSRLLQRLGAEVTALESGAEVETSIAQFRPHLLLIDIGMPGEDGYSLIRRIRRLPAESGGSIPAASLTAHARNEDRARALASGFQAHLPKPVDISLLVTTVRELVQTSAA